MGRRGARDVRGLGMSLPDHLLDEPDDTCMECGEPVKIYRWNRRLCRSCADELVDEYIDERMSEGKR